MSVINFKKLISDTEEKCFPSELEKGAKVLTGVIREVAMMFRAELPKRFSDAGCSVFTIDYKINYNTKAVKVTVNSNTIAVGIQYYDNSIPKFVFQIGETASPQAVQVAFSDITKEWLGTYLSENSTAATDFLKMLLIPSKDYYDPSTDC